MDLDDRKKRERRKVETLEKPKATEYESRKSSTCHPGRVSIRYSDMLLALAEPIASTPTLLTVEDKGIVF